MKKVHDMGRFFLEEGRNIAEKLGLKPQDVRPHQLQVHAKLGATSNSYNFNIARRIGAHVLDFLLDENDFYVAYGLALGIRTVPIISSIERPGNTQPIYFPDPNVFSVAAAAGTVSEAAALEMLYNAQLRIETNQDIRMKEYITTRFRTCPETQTVTSAPTSQNSYTDIPYKDTYTGLGFEGGQNNTIELKFLNDAGEFSKIEGVAGTRVNYAVLQMEGILIVGGAKKATAGRIHQLLSDGR